MDFNFIPTYFFKKFELIFTILGIIIIQKGEKFCYLYVNLRGTLPVNIKICRQTF